MKDPIRPAQFLSEKKLWDTNANKIFLASTVSLKRNIEKFNFPGKLSSDLQKTIIALVSKELMKEPGPKGMLLFPAEKAEAFDKEYLMEHFFARETVFRAHTGEAFMIDDTGSFLVLLNIDNHVEFFTVDVQGEMENSWNRLVKTETFL